jgi:hypothetical protein
MELTRTVRTFGVEDHRWLRDIHGTEASESVMLDMTDGDWVEADHFPDGFVRSGIPVIATTAGRYKVWDATADAATPADGIIYPGGQQVDPDALNDDISAAVVRHVKVRLAFMPVAIPANRLPAGASATLEDD